MPDHPRGPDDSDGPDQPEEGDQPSQPEQGDGDTDDQPRRWYEFELPESEAERETRLAILEKQQLQAEGYDSALLDELFGTDAELGLVPTSTEEAKALVEERVGEHSPEISSVVSKLLDDEKHKLNLTESLMEVDTRERTVDVLAELAAGKALGEQELSAFLADNPGEGTLFEPVPRVVNVDEQDRSRKQAYVDAAKNIDPARRVGDSPDDFDRQLVLDYRDRLVTQVEPAVGHEIRPLIDELQQELGGEVSWSIRSKSAAGLQEKVDRMATGSEHVPPRPGYEVGDVIDAIGARITVDDTEQLGTLLGKIQERLGTGDGGRILEIENMYAQPKSKAPAYRVVPMIIGIEVDGQPYTYELQLTTKRSSIAADMEHNSLYKPYIRTSPEERVAVQRAMDEGAALDQLETRRERDDG